MGNNGQVTHMAGNGQLATNNSLYQAALGVQNSGNERSIIVKPTHSYANAVKEENIPRGIK